MKILPLFGRAVRRLALVVQAAAVVVLVAMVALLAWSGVLGGLRVVGGWLTAAGPGAREALGRGLLAALGWLGEAPLWVTETSEFALLAITFLGAAIALRERAHQGVDVLTRALPPALRRATDRFVWVATGLFGIALAWLGTAYVAHHAAVGGALDSVALPKWLLYLCYPVSGGLIALFSLEGLLEGRPPGREPETGAAEDEREGAA
jgi:TRAP-type C4-dicarboxylate transport system permease small subunit